jgi:hypothetical protein
MYKNYNEDIKNYHTSIVNLSPQELLSEHKHNYLIIPNIIEEYTKAQNSYNNHETQRLQYVYNITKSKIEVCEKEILNRLEKNIINTKKEIKTITPLWTIIYNKIINLITFKIKL